MVYDVEWPAAFESFTRILRAINFDFVDALSLSCLFGRRVDVFSSLLVVLLAPPAVLLVFLAAARIAIARARCTLTGRASYDRRKRIKNISWATAILCVWCGVL